MPKKKDQTSAYDLEISDFDLYHARYDYSDPILIELPGRHVLVGYLVQDDDASNPIEDCDGMGRILHLGRDWQRDQRLEALGLLGLDSDGYIIPDEEGAQKALAFEVRKLDPIISEEEVEQRVENFPNREEWLEKKARELAPIDPLIVLLDYRDYGSSGSEFRVDCMASQWDFSEGGIPDAIWHCDKCLEEELKSHPKEEWPALCKIWAGQAVEEVNKWMAGDVYGVVTEIFKINEDKETESVNDEDSCWGHVGRDWAEEALANAARCAAEYFKEKFKKTKSKNHDISRTHQLAGI